MRPAFLLAPVLLAAAALVGCGDDFERLEFSNPRASQLGGEINRNALTVPEGLILTARIVARDDDNEEMSLDVRSNDTNVVEVLGVISPHDYAFVGKKAGTTTIEFRAEGKVVLRVQATVEPQPSLP
jgi:hypothetical protein